jgi:hypothetical protein
MLATIKNYLQKKRSLSAVTEKNAVDAYDIWAENYDSQPDNLMLHLDGKLFERSLATLISKANR